MQKKWNYITKTNSKKQVILNVPDRTSRNEPFHLTKISGIFALAYREKAAVFMCRPVHCSMASEVIESLPIVHAFELPDFDSCKWGTWNCCDSMTFHKLTVRITRFINIVIGDTSDCKWENTKNTSCYLLTLEQN